MTPRHPKPTKPNYGLSQTTYSNGKTVWRAAYHSGTTRTHKVLRGATTVTEARAARDRFYTSLGAKPYDGKHRMNVVDRFSDNAKPICTP